MTKFGVFLTNSYCLPYGLSRQSYAYHTYHQKLCYLYVEATIFVVFRHTYNKRDAGGYFFVSMYWMTSHINITYLIASTPTTKFKLPKMKKTFIKRNNIRNSMLKHCQRWWECCRKAKVKNLTPDKCCRMETESNHPPDLWLSMKLNNSRCPAEHQNWEDHPRKNSVHKNHKCFNLGFCFSTSLIHYLYILV